MQNVSFNTEYSHGGFNVQYTDVMIFLIKKDVFCSYYKRKSYELLYFGEIIVYQKFKKLHQLKSNANIC